MRPRGLEMDEGQVTLGMQVTHSRLRPISHPPGQGKASEAPEPAEAWGAERQLPRCCTGTVTTGPWGRGSPRSSEVWCLQASR